MPITVSCQCSKSFQAPDTLAGRNVKCPNCGSALSIPPPDADSESLFDDLADLESAAAQAQASSHSGVGVNMSGGHALGSALRTGEGGSPIPTAAIVVGGGVGLVLVVLIVLLIITRGGGDDDGGREIAQSGINSAEQANNSNPDDAQDETTANSNENAAPDNGSQNGSPNPSTNADDPQITTDTGDNTAQQVNGSTNAAPKQTMVAEKMPSGVMTWYSNGKLTSTRRPKDDAGPMLEHQYGWMVGLLPHLGYQNVYDGFDFDRPWLAEKNITHAQHQIPEFLNPADDHKTYVGYPYGGLALTHFVGISGVEDIKDGRNFVAAKLPRSDARAGIFGYEDIAKIDGIRDGTSNTIMIIGSGELACPWVQSGGSTIRGARPPYFAELTGFGSKGDRGRGAIALMADGSVRWIDADVDPQVFRAMCTIAGGESVDVSQLDRGNVQRRRVQSARRYANPNRDLDLWQLLQRGQ